MIYQSTAKIHRRLILYKFDAIDIKVVSYYSRSMENEKISYGKENDLNLKLLISLSRGLGKLNKETNKNIRDFGLSPAQFMVLEVLYHKGEMRVCDITEKILSSGGNMTVVIANLLKEGYVTKHSTQGDRRSYSLKITEKGRTIIYELFPKHLETIKDEFSQLSEEEKLSLIGLLKKMQGLEE